MIDTTLVTRVRRLLAGSAAAVAGAGIALAGLTAPAALASTGGHAPAAPVPATTVHHVKSGTFKTWAAAQRAAGFSLLRPSTTQGLRITRGGIQVADCLAGDNAHGNVWATYQHDGRELAINQDDETGAQPCSNIGEATVLGHYRVDGARATLMGACGTAQGLPSCHAKHLWLFLVWTRHGRYYQVISHNRTRGQAVGFARDLRKVG